MPSVFPGMDPFIEAQEWEDFHTRFNTVIGEQLAPSLEPRYVVRIERRVYVEHPADDAAVRRADVAVVRQGSSPVPSAAPRGAKAMTAECLLPMPTEQRESFLVIRDRQSKEVVTVIETLSPANQRPGGDGRKEYLTKRDTVLQSEAHLIELDLLRGGARLPMLGPLPPGDYYAIVSRRQRRPRAEIYAWALAEALPAIPVPLSVNDPDVALDLQRASRRSSIAQCTICRSTIGDRCPRMRTRSWRPGSRNGWHRWLAGLDRRDLPSPPWRGRRPASAAKRKRPEDLQRDAVFQASTPARRAPD